MSVSSRLVKPWLWVANDVWVSISVHAFYIAFFDCVLLHWRLSGFSWYCGIAHYAILHMYIAMWYDILVLYYVVLLCGHLSGLSWEYTCQSEANVALKTAGEEERIPLTSAEPGLTEPGTPTQWVPASLASQEDLLSMHDSLPSLASSKGWVSSQSLGRLLVIIQSRSCFLVISQRRVSLRLVSVRPERI